VTSIRNQTTRCDVQPVVLPYRVVQSRAGETRLEKTLSLACAYCTTVRSTVLVRLTNYFRGNLWLLRTGLDQEIRPDQRI